MSKKALVVGAGIAGLAAAIRLRCKGYSVDVFEANAYPGGKLTELKQDGFRFDAGPSLFTMPHFVDELCQLARKDPKQYFSYKRKDVVCGYFFADGTRFTAPADEEQFVREASQVFQTPSKTIRSYLNASARKYELTHHLFMERSLHRLSTYLRWDTLKSLLRMGRLDLLTTLHQVNARQFQNPNLVQLFDRYATYNGSDPYQAPGVLSLIPHLEQHLGTYFPSGGMIRISAALYELARDLGVEFHFDSRVEEIVVEQKQAKGLKVKDSVLKADLVLCNMDVVPAYERLLPGLKPPLGLKKQERSSSAIIFYWGIKGSFPELDLHSIFFSANYRKEFDEMFLEKTVPSEPTVYVNITSKEEPADAPPGCENWFVMVNAPANCGQDWNRLIDETRKRVIGILSERLKTAIGPLIQSEAVLDPRLIESRTGSLQGSLYGTSSNSRWSAFLRHPNFSSSIRNLYFCGGSVHPGGGIPLCLLSAKIATETIPGSTR